MLTRTFRNHDNEMKCRLSNLLTLLNRFDFSHVPNNSRWSSKICFCFSHSRSTNPRCINGGSIILSFSLYLKHRYISINMQFLLKTRLISTQGLYYEWRVVWIILASVYISGSLAFLVFGEAKLQAWAAVKPVELEEEETVADGQVEVESSTGLSKRK